MSHKKPMKDSTIDAISAIFIIMVIVFTIVYWLSQ